MASSDVEFPISDAARRMHMDVTFRVTGTRLFTIRCWLAVRLVTLASWVAGFGSANVEIES